jgi:succinate dehydrogenase / fumarate reductase iron-sulfur subunit
MAQTATTQQTATFKVWRGEGDKGELKTYEVPVESGMVVLDAMHYIQGFLSPDLAVRWNCKAAKCGSCSGEVNGKPSLMCKTRLDHLDLSQPIEVRPLATFPLVRDLVTDVSWNYNVNRTIQPFTPPDTDTANWRYYQGDVDRAQEFRKCIECFLCQDTCFVLRNHDRKDAYYGPRFMVRLAGLEMHPMDRADRIPFIKETAGIGLCNINKCCTEVCPEEIHITDNAIIPLKERVVDRYYDPVMWFLRKLGFIR